MNEFVSKVSQVTYITSYDRRKDKFAVQGFLDLILFQGYSAPAHLGLLQQAGQSKFSEVQNSFIESSQDAVV